MATAAPANCTPMCALTPTCGTIDPRRLTPRNPIPNCSIGRLREISDLYPDKPVLMTEFGWPGQPGEVFTAPDAFGAGCNVISVPNKNLVASNTLGGCRDGGLGCILFQAFTAPYEAPRVEQWFGFCDPTSPFGCAFPAIESGGGAASSSELASVSTTALTISSACAVVVAVMSAMQWQH